MKEKDTVANKILDISTFSLKDSLFKSFTKKRTTFWQMLRCMMRLEYKPSVLLICVILAAFIYLVSPLNLFSGAPFYLRYLDDLFMVFVVLKTFSHETMRYTRYKAKGRRSCH